MIRDFHGKKMVYHKGCFSDMWCNFFSKIAIFSLLVFFHMLGFIFTEGMSSKQVKLSCEFTHLVDEQARLLDCS